MYLNDMLNELYPDKAMALDLGDDLNYDGYYVPSQFNAFENALQSFTRVGQNLNYGSSKVYQGNTAFIGYQDLNRIESNCLKWYNYTPILTKSINISPSAQIINLYESYTFTVTCKPDNAEDKADFTVSSSDTSIVSVVKDGMNIIATAVGTGNASITVSINGHTATANIKAQEVLVTNITPSESNFNVNIGESKIITFSFIPSNATNAKNWTVSTTDSSASVVKLNDTQISVTGNAGGETIITITCGNVSAKIRATVPVILKDLWLSNKKMDASYEGNLEANCPRIAEWQTSTGMTWIDTLYVITDPVSAYNPNYSFNSSNSNAVFVYKESWNENDKLFIVGKQVGKESNVTVNLGGLSWTTKVKVW